MSIPPELAECLNRLTGNAISTVVVDVAALTFCDSSGLSVFVTSRRRAHEQGATIILRSPGEPVERLLTLMKLGTVLNVERDGHEPHLHGLLHQVRTLAETTTPIRGGFRSGT